MGLRTGGLGGGVPRSAAICAALSSFSMGCDILSGCATGACGSCFTSCLGASGVPAVTGADTLPCCVRA